MKKSKFFLLTLALVTFIMLVGCAPSEKMLAAYGDDKIISQNSNNYLEINSVENKNADRYTYRAGQFSGVKKVKAVTINTNPCIDIDLTINDGEFKIVFVNNDKEVFLIADQGCNETLQVQLPSGTYDMKIVGRYADVELTFAFNFSYL